MLKRNNLGNLSLIAPRDDVALIKPSHTNKEIKFLILNFKSGKGVLIPMFHTYSVILHAFPSLNINPLLDGK